MFDLEVGDLLCSWVMRAPKVRIVLRRLGGGGGGGTPGKI